MDQAEAAICAALRGEPGIWRQLADPLAAERFVTGAARHRVRSLLAWTLHRTGELSLWPEPVRRALIDAQRAEAALEVVRAIELRRLAASFAAAGVPMLVFKGAALAYSIYPEPWLRPREDTDILVDAADASRASDLLTGAGYRPLPMQRGDLVSHQRAFVRHDPGGRRHACDLHWKIANPVAFSDLLTPAELLAESSPLPLGDGATARSPNPVHAFLLACWHRVSHHHDSGDLLWLYDLHLLAAAFSDSDGARAASIARRTGTTAVCARGIALAVERFGTRVPAALSAAPSLDEHEALTSVYLNGDVRKIDLLAADLRGLPDWPSRLRLIREHLFPPADYIFAVSGRSHPALLPALYLRRIVRGSLAWFRRSAARRP